MPPRKRMATRARPANSEGQGSRQEERGQQSHPIEREEPYYNEEEDLDYIEEDEIEFNEESDEEEVQTVGQRGENLRDNPMDQFMLLLRQNLEQHPNPMRPDNSSANAFRAFKSLKPPEFQGTADPVEARAWLKEVEKSFEILSIAEDQKTVFATYLLKGEANYWWEARRNLEGRDVVTWERFSQLFLEKYFPRFMETQMELKFLELKQGNMTVAEYEAKFSELSRFVPEFVNTEAKRARRFQQGLKQWIQNRVAVLELADYVTLVQKATIVEAGSEQSQREKEGKKRKRDSHGGNSTGKSFLNRFSPGARAQPNRSFSVNRAGSWSVGQGGRQIQTGVSRPNLPRPSFPECNKCGKRHPASAASKW